MGGLTRRCSMRSSICRCLRLRLGLVAGYLPIAYVKFVRNRRLLKFEEQFPEAMDLLGRALRAGHALTTGLAMVARGAAEAHRT